MPDTVSENRRPDRDNSTVICWKWQDETLLEDMERSVAELLERFRVHMVFVPVHWVTRRFDDPVLQEKLRECAALLAARGVGLCVEACFRNEAEGFYEAYPDDPPAFLAHYEELALDEAGRGETHLPAETVWHYWRRAAPGPQEVLGAWCFEPEAGNHVYRPGSLCGIRDGVRLEPAAADGGERVLSVDAGAGQGGKTACVCLLTRQAIPDLASPRLPAYFRRMAALAAKAGARGVFSDEWGYDVILDIREPNPYDDKHLFLRHLSYSAGMADIYRTRNPGRDLADDTLHLRWCPAGKPAVRIAAVNRYTDTLRYIMAENDRAMYGITKELLGPDAFYGIHPTWWGSVDKLNFETFKNGFYWWEAVRDVAQTDEAVILPIRTALAHKWGSAIFYNMWYSMGTRDIRTYFRETYRNLRFGGRTHYHSYKCPNEPVVLELAGDGLLEDLERMEARVRLADRVQETAPDCRLLVLFGMEAATNWALTAQTVPPWTVENPVLDAVLNTAHALFDRCLLDLVPTSEIAGGSLSADAAGRAVYGTQAYDAVMLWFPESMAPACYPFLKKLNPARLAVYGGATMYSDGRSLSREDRALFRAARQHGDKLPAPEVLAEVAQDMGVPFNRIDSGCALQDGCWQFAAEGEKPAGNPLLVDALIRGRHVHFEGEDFLFLDLSGTDQSGTDQSGTDQSGADPSGETPRAVYPAGGLTVDWRPCGSLALDETAV